MELAEQRATRLKEFTRGDLEAFESLFREHQRSVYGWVLKIVRDPSLAEDCTIEAFWRAYRSREHFDSAREFEPWIRRIATNVSIAQLKRKRPEAELPDDLTGAGADSGVSRETRERIALAFEQLPVKLRVPAILSLIEERSTREIADALGITEIAVRSRVFRATKQLRTRLERWGYKP